MVECLLPKQQVAAFLQVLTQNDQPAEKCRDYPGQLRPAALSLNSVQPTLLVRQGKGNHSRIVPVHPELLNALTAELQFADLGRGSITGVSRATALR